MSYEECYLGAIIPKKKLLERVYALFAHKVIDGDVILYGVDQRPHCAHFAAVVGVQGTLISLKNCFETDVAAQNYIEALADDLDRLIASRLGISRIEMNYN